MALLCVWFAYVGLMDYAGVLGNTAIHPPGIVFVFLPVIVFLIFVVVRARTAAGDASP